jgi:hypothetical protein
MPVKIKKTIIQDNILPRRFRFDIPATAEEMEKNTSGTIAVNRRFRKASPKGLKIAASFLKTTPRVQPKITEAIKRIEKPYDLNKPGSLIIDTIHMGGYKTLPVPAG